MLFPKDSQNKPKDLSPNYDFVIAKVMVYGVVT